MLIIFGSNALDRPSSVDRIHHARYEISVIGSQEEHHGRDLLRLRQSVEEARFGVCFVHLRGKTLEDRCVHDSRRYGIDPYVFRCKVKGGLPRQGIHATFGRLVAQGAKVRYTPTQKPWGGFLASVYDPDGNLIGISQRQSGQ